MLLRKLSIWCVFIALSSYCFGEEGIELPGEATAAVKAKNPAYAEVVDEPGLPRVLLIGDSISIGYTVAARKMLEGKANVHRIPANGGDTGRGLERLSAWLDPKKGKWDLIHFNWGLWDLCYRNPESKTQGRRDKVNGSLTYTPEQYAANLETLVLELKPTGAKLVFATTTPVPEGEAGRKLGDDEVYNRAAIAVMKRHGVSVNDLNGVMAGKMDQYGRAPGDVHFIPEGSELLGAKVAEAIEDALTGSP